MKLEKSTENQFLVELSELELDMFQAGLRETLQELEDWEFQTRTGFEREEIQNLIRNLVAQRKETC